jgi:hypothetical protein
MLMKRVLGIPGVHVLRGALALSAASGVVGCGSSAVGPQTYVLDRDSNRVPVGSQISIGPFSVPSGAVIDYFITDTPSASVPTA